MTKHLIILTTWNYNGCTGYSEHVGTVEECRTLAEKSMQETGVYQSRATAYRYSNGTVANAFNCGRFNPGWRFNL